MKQNDKIIFLADFDPDKFWDFNNFDLEKIEKKIQKL